MWDIPFIPELLAKPWQISCPVVLQALSQKPNLPQTLPLEENKEKKVPDQRIGRKKKEQVKQSSNYINEDPDVQETYNNAVDHVTEILNQTVNPTLSIEDIEHAINEVNQAKKHL